VSAGHCWVVRELLLGPKRFTDLRAGDAGREARTCWRSDFVSSRRPVVVRQHKLPTTRRLQVYELTDWAPSLSRSSPHLGRWGSRSPSDALRR